MEENNNKKSKYIWVSFKEKHNGENGMGEALSDLNEICESFNGILEAEFSNYQGKSRMADCTSVSSIYFLGNAIVKNEFVKSKDNTSSWEEDHGHYARLLDSGTRFTTIDYVKGNKPGELITAFCKIYKKDGVKETLK